MEMNTKEVLDEVAAAREKELIENEVRDEIRQAQMEGLSAQLNVKDQKLIEMESERGEMESKIQ